MKLGVVWLRAGKNPHDGDWIVQDVSGPDGIKYDRIELIDMDEDGDLDVLLCEERQQQKGLGVIWYENPGQPR